VANLWKNIQQLKSLNCPFEIDEIRLEAVWADTGGFLALESYGKDSYREVNRRGIFMISMELAPIPIYLYLSLSALFILYYTKKYTVNYCEATLFRLGKKSNVKFYISHWFATWIW
jgi:hypothetical protein